MFFEKDAGPQNGIPFFPAYDYENVNGVSVWWFEREFSQGQYGKHAHRGTNSCTLITVLTAQKIAQGRIKTVTNSSRLPYEVVETFAKAILDGNANYARLYNEGKLTNVNLNIPEAMEALKKLLKNLEEWFYVHTHLPVVSGYKKHASEKLFSVLRDGLDMWHMVYEDREYLFVIMIADNRSIVLCFQKSTKTLTLFDSHQHSAENGALIAQTCWKNLIKMCEWIIHMFVEIYQTRPNVFELSFIPTKKCDSSEKS
ncbi:unnamed protein product [Hermetia illucens]|uniref:Uncharacterized protein n=1 Tax=Hermetia illucens TaxID=343691 RepID=A0A7R8YRD6_HERIL|nr:uncharacterized protein LOC119650377 [Hermetia illucens]CAD7082746.1 unnamed protein product [Hermetia illucens]